MPEYKYIRQQFRVHGNKVAERKFRPRKRKWHDDRQIKESAEFFCFQKYNLFIHLSENQLGEEYKTSGRKSMCVLLRTCGPKFRTVQHVQDLGPENGCNISTNLQGIGSKVLSWIMMN